MTSTSNIHPRYAIDEPPRGDRRSLLERVPEGASVLDVGCWAGAVGRFLIEHRATTVDGIEPEEAMAALASRFYRNVFVGTIEDYLASQRQFYDRLLLLDVLEHLAEPSDSLMRCTDLLNADGRALVSVPNVAHWSVRKDLLLGRWRYQEYGILDRTHLRFFTLDSAAELLVAAGWEITWRSVSPGQPPLFSLPERWLGALKRWPSLFAVQALFEARPASGKVL